MLDYIEDYTDFVKGCEKNLESIKINQKNDVINGITPPADDWSMPNKQV